MLVIKAVMIMMIQGMNDDSVEYHRDADDGNVNDGNIDDGDVDDGDV